MSNQQSLQWIESLTNASFLWGPFFFSILFMLVITRTAHSYYSRVNERVSPPATEDERKDYRFYFRLSISFGTFLVFISVAWWIYAQLQQHTFQGVIVGLREDQQIVGTDDDLYYRLVQRDLGDKHIMKDYHFAIVQNTPFSNGQPFRLDFYQNSGVVGATPPAPIKLQIQYRGGTYEKFQLMGDAGSFKLQPLSGAGK